MTLVERETGSAREQPSPHRLLIDASGVMRNYGAAPTGIPRVEAFLVKAALRDDDPRVDLVSFERGSGRFRLLGAREREHLAQPEVTLPSSSLSGWAALKYALAAVKRYPFAGREADRQLAGMVREKGLLFVATKLLIRAWRSIWRLLERSGGWGDGALLSGDSDGDCVLLSNTNFLGAALPKTGGTAGVAFICHDIIPAVRPDFVVHGKQAARFSANLAHLMRSKAVALCASQASARMLAGHLASLDIEPGAIHRFAMPSALQAQALAEGQATRLPSSEPFVLYCSTIEVRKNHLLLARVWLQAQRDKVRLPKLVCVGKWGWGVSALKTFLVEHPELDDTVSFVGAVGDKELVALYRSASFGVFPSYMEGWGYAASECLDFGIPVIVSTDPALVEATGGLMPSIDPDDQAGWYAAIRRMAEDAAWRQEHMRLIAERHRPTPPAESWASIKRALLPGA